MRKRTRGVIPRSPSKFLNQEPEFVKKYEKKERKEIVFFLPKQKKKTIS
jgi:hypothetical protein